MVEKLNENSYVFSTTINVLNINDLLKENGKIFFSNNLEEAAKIV